MSILWHLDCEVKGVHASHGVIKVEYVSTLSNLVKVFFFWGGMVVKVCQKFVDWKLCRNPERKNVEVTERVAYFFFNVGHNELDDQLLCSTLLKALYEDSRSNNICRTCPSSSSSDACILPSVSNLRQYRRICQKQPPIIVIPSLPNKRHVLRQYRTMALIRYQALLCKSQTLMSQSAIIVIPSLPNKRRVLRQYRTMALIRYQALLCKRQTLTTISQCVLLTGI